MGRLRCDAGLEHAHAVALTEPLRPHERHETQRPVAPPDRAELPTDGAHDQGDQRFRRLAESIDQVLWLQDTAAERPHAMKHGLSGSAAFRPLH